LNSQGGSKPPLLSLSLALTPAPLSSTQHTGGISAAVSKTAAAPIERVKLLIQVRKAVEGRGVAQGATRGVARSTAAFL
jgi:hypothetical protein